jgi:hypothetical protein
MFNNTNKQVKNAATNNAVQAFLDAGHHITRDTRKGKRERVGTPVNYFTSADAPTVAKVDNWETKLAKLAALGNEHPGCINVQWGNDGRVANSVAEMYGL